MSASTIQPGCNMPSVPFSPESPDLWWYEITANEDGTITADLAGEGTRVTSRFQHLAFFPTWSEGHIGHFSIAPGQTVRLDASAENTLRVTTEQGEVTYPGHILIVSHRAIQGQVAAYYSQEG